MSMPAPNASHNQKHHVAPDFNYLDQTNIAVPLMIPLTLHDNDGVANGIT